MNLPTLNLRACDREPIHVPEAIQPHGVLLVLDPSSLDVERLAGDPSAILGVGGAPGLQLGALLDPDGVAAASAVAEGDAPAAYLGVLTSAAGVPLEASAQRTGGRLVLELTPAEADPPTAAEALSALEEATRAFQAAADMAELCGSAAEHFRRLTGFDRVMIYRFLEDGAGRVIAEAKIAELPTFLHHHFPASDVPVQARALYIRNPIRAIVDVQYTPAPLLPPAETPLDMSACELRSVSPVHLEYLRNMGVGASMSVSLLRDGGLWGLVAMHHRTAKAVPRHVRSGCTLLAQVLARQIAALEEAQTLRQGLQLRAAEDELARAVGRATSVDAGLEQRIAQVLATIPADGVAFCRGDSVAGAGRRPADEQVTALVRWTCDATDDTFLSDRLPTAWSGGAAMQALGSGVAALVLSCEERSAIVWFRAEQVEVLTWAGDPHRAADRDPAVALTPRQSFADWSETVRGRSHPWTRAEAESVERLRDALQELRAAERLRRLNAELRESLADRDALLAQKGVLLQEVNHRVKNSLQLVSSMLSLQLRETTDEAARAQLEEARRRLGAVGLVHRRLYQSDQIESIDLGRYLQELRDELVLSLGDTWAANMRVEAPSLLIQTDRAVTLGLVVTEIVTNAVKYAYGGAPGPVAIEVQTDGAQLQVAIADRGVGRGGAGAGFGTRLLTGLTRQLKGEIAYTAGNPGTRALLTLPLDAG